MADIINLRRARKAKVKAVKELQAAENRAKFGRPKVERGRQEAERQLAARRLDGTKRTARSPDDKE